MNLKRMSDFKEQFIISKFEMFAKLLLKDYQTSLSFWYNITIDLNHYSKQIISAFQPNKERKS
jgi:hypothetical protein